MSSASVRMKTRLRRSFDFALRPTAASHMAAVRLPAALEVMDQFWIVETKRLLTRVCCHVAAIDRERLLTDTQRFTVADGAGEAGANHLGGVFFDSLVHLRVIHRLVADHLALRRIGPEFTLKEYALARQLDADEARQTKIGAAGNEALFARRQIEIAAVDRHNAIHHAKELAAAADGVRLDCSQPGLLDIILELLAVGFRPPVAAVNLVQKPKLAFQDEVGKCDLSVIQMREIDAGIENATAGIFRMIDRAPAQNANFDPVIEEG